MTEPPPAAHPVATERPLATERPTASAASRAALVNALVSDKSAKTNKTAAASASATPRAKGRPPSDPRRPALGATQRVRTPEPAREAEARPARVSPPEHEALVLAQLDAEQSARPGAGDTNQPPRTRLVTPAQGAPRAQGKTQFTPATGLPRPSLTQQSATAPAAQASAPGPRRYNTPIGRPATVVRVSGAAAPGVPMALQGRPEVRTHMGVAPPPGLTELPRTHLGVAPPPPVAAELAATQVAAPAAASPVATRGLAGMVMPGRAPAANKTASAALAKTLVAAVPPAPANHSSASGLADTLVAMGAPASPAGHSSASALAKTLLAADPPAAPPPARARERLPSAPGADAGTLAPADVSAHRARTDALAATQFAAPVASELNAPATLRTSAPALEALLATPAKGRVEPPEPLPYEARVVPAQRLSQAELDGLTEVSAIADFSELSELEEEARVIPAHRLSQAELDGLTEVSAIADFSELSELEEEARVIPAHRLSQAELDGLTEVSAIADLSQFDDEPPTFDENQPSAFDEVQSSAFDEDQPTAHYRVPELAPRQAQPSHGLAPEVASAPAEAELDEYVIPRRVTSGKLMLGIGFGVLAAAGLVVLGVVGLKPLFSESAKAANPASDPGAAPPARAAKAPSRPGAAAAPKLPAQKPAAAATPPPNPEPAAPAAPAAADPAPAADAPSAGSPPVDAAPSAPSGAADTKPASGAPEAKTGAPPWQDTEAVDTGSCETLAGPARPGPKGFLLQEAVKTAQEALMQGDTKAAHVAFCRALTLGEPTATVLIGLTQVLLMQGDFEEALATIDRALEKKAKNAQALDLRGDVLVRMGRVEEARQAWFEAAGASRASATLVDNLFKASRMAAKSAVGAGDLARADRMLRRAIALDPSHAASVNDLAMVLTKRGQSAAAERWTAYAASLAG